MPRRTLARILLVPFLLLTGWASLDGGPQEILLYQTRSPAGWQVLIDLVIALLFVLTWLVQDARRTGRNPWPWVVATFLTGSISPLVYFATGPADDA